MSVQPVSFSLLIFSVLIMGKKWVDAILPSRQAAYTSHTQGSLWKSGSGWSSGEDLLSTHKALGLILSATKPTSPTSMEKEKSQSFRLAPLSRVGSIFSICQFGNSSVRHRCFSAFVPCTPSVVFPSHVPLRYLSFLEHISLLQAFPF